MGLLRTIAVVLACMLDLSFGSSSSMTCGTNVPLCGTLTLQTGLGSGVYHGNTTKVHGLWPETGSYGTSKCIKPTDTSNPTKVYDCYNQDSSALWFETHEWTKHGQCAGVKDSDDFFTQVCSLSKAPLQVLQKAKEAGKGFSSMTQALKDAGYPVWSLDTSNDQVELSVCAKTDGRWVLAAVSDMPSKCGDSSPSPAPGPSPPGPSPPAPSPAPSPSTGSCVPGRQGPKCSSDADCTGLSGCVRCAHSGYCTDQKLPTIFL